MSNSRLPLITYQRSVFTPDTLEAIRRLEVSAANRGNLRTRYKGRPSQCSWPMIKDVPGPTGLPAYTSLWLTGREVHISLELDQGSATSEEMVAYLWGLAVPLGFTPWNRYPVAGATEEVFHYFGPWQSLYDSLCGEGRGELALSSVACAAQLDVGAWEGERPLERYIQAQLHRTGFPCGPLDGIVGDRTLSSLRSAGLQGSSLLDAANALNTRSEPQVEERDRNFSYLVAPGRDIHVHSFGQVSTMRTPSGSTIAVDGPGRVVIDFS